jgi:hypothetical protein
MSVVGSPVCQYAVSNPKVNNTAYWTGVTSLTLSPGLNQFASYCSAALPGSSESSYQTADTPTSTAWTCWAPVAFYCNVPDATDCGTQNGCACNAFATNGGGNGSCFITTQLTCQRFGS